MILCLRLLLLGLITLSLASMALAEDREADHNELRAMLRTATEAMNTGNIDALRPLFYDKISITTVDQQLFTNLDDFKAYYEGLLKGSNARLKSIAFKPEADALTELVGEQIGLSHGTSTDTYTFTDGDVRTMTSRWTATVYKDNGKWKILNLHIGTNLLDNPVTATLKGYLKKATIAAGVGGLIVGFILARLMRGRRRRSYR
jgi:hypothetical protein